MSQGPVPTPPPPAPATSGMPVIAIVAIVLVIVVFILGVLAAIAIPSFVNYMRRAKATEAETNVDFLGRSVVSAYAEQGALPAPLPPTPAPACQRRMWPPDAAPGWEQFMFHPVDPLYYSYSIEPMPGTNGVWVRAIGDLDCDGIYSRFERSVIVGPSGGADLGPLIVTDETE